MERTRSAKGTDGVLGGIIAGKTGLITAAAVVSVLSFIAYSNTFSSPFLFDDDLYIVRNPGIRSLANIWPPTGTRFMGYLTFALNYASGGFDTTGYHAVNLVIHVLNSLLLYLLIRLIFLTPAMSGGGVGGGAGLPTDSKLGEAAGPFALFVSTLFALHPVQTESVTYITQRFTSLAFFFYVLSVVLFLSWRAVSGREGGGGKIWALYALSVLSAVLAMKTKEIAFTLPAAIALLDLAFFGKGGFMRRPAAFIPYLLTMAIIPLSFLIPGEQGGDGGFGLGVASSMKALQKMELSGLSKYEYLITEFRVIVRYFRLLAFPSGQNIYYDYPFFKSVFNPEVFLSLLFILSLIAFSVYLFIRSLRKGSRWGLLATTGIFWFFMTISVESSFVPIYDAIYEHRLYLPSAGVFIAFGALLFYWAGRLWEGGGSSISVPYHIVSAVFIAVFTLPLGAATYGRNLVWKDAVSLWEDSVNKSPWSSLSRQNLGSSYYRIGRVEEAESEFKEAAALKPDFFLPRYNLGVLYQETGRYQEAVSELKEALRIEPGHLQSRYNLGITYMAMGRPKEAAKEYERALSLKPDFFEVRFALAQAYESLGRRDEALSNYSIFVEKAPDDYREYKERARLKIASIAAEKH